jgi:hypothetical protein
VACSRAMLGLGATVVKHSPNAGSALRNRHLWTSAASLFDRNPPQQVEVADNLASAQHHNGSSAMHAGSPVSPSTRFNYCLWTCIHRVGRTGRAGARGFASTLVSGAEVSEFRRIERALRLRIKRKKTEYNHLVREWRCRENNLPSRTLHSDAGRGIHNSHCFGAIGVALSRGNI